MGTPEDMPLDELGRRVSAARAATEARGETFYQGASRVHLAAFPPRERWDDWVELSSRAWPAREERHYMLVPTTCFNCESACGLLAYVDRATGQVRKFEGNPEHPGSRGRNCAKGPATINQVTDPDRILYPMKRSGPRGSGRWERVSWDEALDALAARIRAAITQNRRNEIMVHLGRPGEDGYTERVLASWGVDGHNSHTNVCSSGGRTGFQFWMGIDRPSPDHAHATVIYLISAHLESGHYFNPHAQRITEARANGAKVIVLDTRLSNTATHADYWLSPQPGSEAAINLAVANHLIQTQGYDRDFVRRWWNWAEYLTQCHPDVPVTFEAFEEILAGLYADFTFGFAAAESGIDASVLAEVASVVAGAGSRFACHSWRSAAAGNLGGWQVSRTLFLISALLGAVATEGGTFPNAWNKFVPRPIHVPPHPGVWQELSWPLEYPLAQNEMSFLLPHFLKDGRGRLDTYFIRVYNPVWTNPDGLSWMEVLRDEDKVGCFVALTPTWNESAWFADYVLPMGHGSERHDTHSYEQYDGQWVGFRQPVLRAAQSRLGEQVTDTRQVNPGEVWEENEFWIELSWRIDPDGSLGIRQYHESRAHPGSKLTVDEYYGWMFANSVPGLPERAAAEGLSPLEWMRRYGAFEITRGQGAQHEQEVPAAELADLHVSPSGRVYTSAAPAPSANIVPAGAPVAGRGGPPGGRGHGGRRGPARLPDAVRAAGVLVLDASRVGLAGARATRLHPQPRAPLAAGGGPGGAAVHVPAADPDPYPVGERQMAGRARAHQPGLDPPGRRGPVRHRPHRGPGAGRDRDRPLRREGLDHRGDPARGDRLQPSHGPVAAGRRTAWCGRHDGHRRPAPRRRRLADGTARARRGLFVGRPGQPADLVERYRCPPEPDLQRPPGPDLRHALLAPGRPGPPRHPGRPARRHRGRHRPGTRGLPAVAAPDPPGGAGLTRRHPAPTLADASAQAGRRGVRDPGGLTRDGNTLMTDAAAPPATGRWELFRALGAIAGDPADARTACAALGWTGPDNVEHTEVFVLNCPPYASVYLGAEGGLGGEAADRAAGFWRAIGLAPPAEPDHLATLFGLYASLGEAAGDTRTAATADALTRARHALFWEHLWPWLPGYLDAVADLEAPGLAPWARLARRVLLTERDAHPGGWLPLALRAAPEPGPADGLDAMLDLLTCPVRSGFILTRRSLAAGAKAAGAGHRIGERRFTLRALLEQAPADTVNWLAGEATRWSRRHAARSAGRDGGPRSGDIVQAWWARRAGHTARILATTTADKPCPAGALK